MKGNFLVTGLYCLTSDWQCEQSNKDTKKKCDSIALQHSVLSLPTPHKAAENLLDKTASLR